MRKLAVKNQMPLAASLGYDLREHMNPVAIYASYKVAPLYGYWYCVDWGKGYLLFPNGGEAWILAYVEEDEDGIYTIEALAE